jgi:hypothetical protein
MAITASSQNITLTSMNKELESPLDPENNAGDEITNIDEDLTTTKSCWDSAKSCDFSGANAHEWIASLAGVATVISGIVAVLIIFVGGSSKEQSSDHIVVSNTTLSGECLCPNGIGTIDCYEKIRYQCEECDSGFVKVDTTQNKQNATNGTSMSKTSICKKKVFCLENQDFDETSNQCVDKTEIIFNCFCDHGSKAGSIDCPAENLHLCSFCDSGYGMSDGICMSDCPFGEHELQNNVCAYNVCVCSNGELQ